MHALLFIDLFPVVMSLLQVFLPPLLGHSITGQLSLALTPLVPVALSGVLRITLSLSNPALLGAITGHSPGFGPVFSILVAAFAATSLQKGVGKISFMGFLLEGIFQEVRLPNGKIENIRFMGSCVRDTLLMDLFSIIEGCRKSKKLCHLIIRDSDF
jgi:hypothetical protein